MRIKASRNRNSGVVGLILSLNRRWSADEGNMPGDSPCIPPAWNLRSVKRTMRKFVRGPTRHRPCHDPDEHKPRADLESQEASPGSLGLIMHSCAAHHETIGT